MSPSTDLQNLPPLTPAELKTIESPAWAPFFAQFPEDTDPKIKGHMVRQFIDMINRDLMRIFKRSLARIKQKNREALS